MRFLCFHGAGTNAKVFEQQTARLRQALSRDHTFVFVNGTVRTEPLPGIDPAQGGSFRWLSEELSHLQATHSSVLRLVERRGPFDGVMGFSEGGAVAAALLVLDARQRFAHFKCGIFFCAAAPMDPETVLQGDTGFMDAARDGVVIHVPTAHIWASNDEKHELMGKDLVGLCNAALREEYVHEMGHSVPSGDAFPQMLRAVERTIERAKSLG